VRLLLPLQALTGAADVLERAAELLLHVLVGRELPRGLDAAVALLQVAVDRASSRQRVAHVLAELLVGEGALEVRADVVDRVGHDLSASLGHVPGRPFRRLRSVEYYPCFPADRTT
jgi:hypothetical protein